MKYIKTFPLELFIWVIALMLLATANSHQHHFILCPLANLGYENWCPGCGLGRSIGYLFHGEFNSSFHEHWFGLPALLILLYRIYTLTRNKIEFKISSQNT